MTTDRRPVHWQAGLISAAAVLGVGVYLAWSNAYGARGFALDDAWIHQTYARNLALTGRFEFAPGQPSAGSTSVTWTLLLALGYLARLDFRVWTFTLGTVCLVMTALGARALTGVLFPGHPRAALAAGILGALEWHLLWSAVSGMETLLFTALSLWVMVQINRPKSKTQNQGHDLALGLGCGALVLTRPDGLLLIGLVLAQAGLRGWTRRATWAGLVWTVIGMAIPLAPWMTFNWLTSGTLLPNTFYAKQREYAELLAALSLPQRVVQVFAQPFIGPLVLLLPGLWAALLRRAPAGAGSLARRMARPEIWPRLVPLGWAIMHLATYALRLPVTYQHGRYEIPVIPIFIALGVGGTARLLRLNDAGMWARVFSRAAVLSLGITLLAFVALGARAYATDVSIIEGEMVTVARWLDANAAPGDLTAAHDIGALGYLARQPLLDLAGLVSPEVIPFIRDEARLDALIRQRGATFLVAFPSWYPRLTGQLSPVFSGSAVKAPEHLTVYRLR